MSQKRNGKSIILGHETWCTSMRVVKWVNRVSQKTHNDQMGALFLMNKMPCEQKTHGF